jgi:hypothetical protein
MIELTVALPVWNSKRILWLALEGLCNQVHPGCDWELLIMEEQINEFGADEVAKYAERLKTVGCTSLRYFPLDYQFPLPQKWKFMAERAASTSKMFLLQAADNYPEPLRLKKTIENSDCDWLQDRCAYLYSFHYRTIIEFDQAIFGSGCKTGSDMAIKTDLLRRLPESFEKSGIDHWLMKHTGAKNIKWLEGSVPGGVSTDGLNNISFARRFNFENPKPPFKACDKKLDDIVPEYISEKLKLTAPR